MVIGVIVGQMSECGFTLNPDKVSVIIDIERGLGGIAHTPHHHRRDFDGVSAFVVDLQLFPVEITGTFRDAGLGIKWVGPEEAAPDLGTAVISEQQQDHRFVGLQCEMSEQQDQQHRCRDGPDGDGTGHLGKEACCCSQQQDHVQEQSSPATSNADGILFSDFRHRRTPFPFSSSHLYHYDIIQIYTCTGRI